MIYRDEEIRGIIASLEQRPTREPKVIAAMLRQLLSEFRALREERENFSTEMKRRDDNWIQAMMMSQAVVKEETGREFSFAYPSHLANQQEASDSLARAHGLTPPQEGEKA